MPRLNLRDDGMEGEPLPIEDTSSTPPPTLREVGGGSSKSSPVLLIVLIVAVLAASVFALNQFKVIHLWGKKVPKTETALGPDPGLPVPDAAGGEQGTPPPPDTRTTAATDQPAVDPTLVPVEKPSTKTSKATEKAKGKTAKTVTKPAVTESKPVAPPPQPTIQTSGSGAYTVQVSSWQNKAKADEEVAKLTAAGLTSFVEEATVNGEQWFRVRVGKYASLQEARQAAVDLQKMMESRIFVAKGK